MIKILNYIEKSAATIIIVFTVCQVVTSLVFFWRSRKIKEINWLPKFIMGLAILEGIMWSSYYITTIYFEIQVSAIVLFCLTIIPVITSPTLMGLIIRFQRVQVQLRAQEENTIKILKTIKRANILEVVFIITLIVIQI